MTITINGQDLTLTDIRAVAQGAKVALTDDAAILARIEKSRQVIAGGVERGEQIYGVTTLFGGMADQYVGPDLLANVQRIAVWQHKSTTGPRLPAEDVRAAMLLRANSFVKGASGVRREIIERYIAFLNAGAHPHVHQRGSIGASGDLVPLSYIGGAVIGLDPAFLVDLDGETLDAHAALSRIGLEPLTLQPKEGLALNPDGRTINRIVSVSQYDARAFTGDVRFNANTFTGPLEHKIAFGVDQQYADLGSAFGGGTVGPIDLYEPVYGNLPILTPLSARTVTNTRQTGLYVSDQVRYDRLFVSGGLRYDIARDGAGNTENVLSKDVGLLYAFDNGISPYVSYAESFLPTNGIDASGSPFRPRRGDQIEAGIKYQPVGSASIFTAAVFQIEENGRLVGDPNNPGFQAQLGDVTIKGFELEAQTKINEEFELLAGYSYLDTRTAAGFRLASAPTHLASAWGTWRPGGEWEGFKLGAGVRYVGSSFDGVDQIETPDYVLADAMIGYEAETWDVTLNARNLFDKKHVTTCLARGDCFYGERRTVALKLTSKF